MKLTVIALLSTLLLLSDGTAWAEEFRFMTMNKLQIAAPGTVQ